MSIDGSLKDSVGVKNPYRYRGYRYDTETGLYYLNSRYYNPEWGRFINADAIAGSVGELLGANVFAYCENNCVSMHDDNGDRPDFSDGTGHETEDERNASFSCMNRNLVPDKTDEAMNQLRTNASNTGGFVSWYNKVNHRGEWDYKRLNRRLYWMPQGGKFKFNGIVISAEDYGNINFGYTGLAVGLNRAIIFQGGGWAKLSNGKGIWGKTVALFKSGFSKYNGDDYNDHVTIQYGIDLYHLDNPNPYKYTPMLP